MRALRSLYLRRTLKFGFSLKSNQTQTTTCCKALHHYQFAKKFHCTPDKSSLASDNESVTPVWSVFPNSQSPVDSSNRQSPTVENIYDPSLGRVVPRRVYNGDKERDSCAEKLENTSSIQEESRTYGDVLASSKVITSTATGKKGKSRSVHVCESCGYSDGKWWGTCRECKQVGTMKRVTIESGDGRVSGSRVSDKVIRSWLPNDKVASTPIKISDVNRRIDESKWRIPLAGPFGAEVETVLGGGLVPGSVVLVGGEPGVGKSTLLLQIAALLAESNGTETDAPVRVIYVSGEESIDQIGNRGNRLHINTEDLYLLSSTDLEDILEQAKNLSAGVLVIDSIQTVYLNGVNGSAGSIGQVKECASALLRFAKQTNIPVLLIGHVNKAGDIAGPRELEHIVDVVLYMEGERFSSHRLLRSAKNRFGSTDELGVFRMSEFGLQDVPNPSEMFLGEQHPDSDYLAGSAVAVIMDGSRAFLIEIQALCVVGSSGSRHANGIKSSRVDMLISVITKQAGLKLQENGIFINVVSGIELTETGGDLAIAAAICSSFLECPIQSGTAFIAEIDLGGQLRVVPRLEKRIYTLAKLGYKKCVVPKSVEKSFSELQLQGMGILGCKDLKEMINTVFVAR